MNEKYRDIFVEEAHEHIENLNASLLKLEKNPGNKESIDSIFRSVHTIKGMALAMGYEEITRLCTEMEDILDRKRTSGEELSRNQITQFFGCIDILEELIDDDSKKIDIEKYLDGLKENNIAKNDTEKTKKLDPTSMRVKMKDLDYLVNLVGDLVISKMRLDESLKTADHESKQALITLGRITSELQGGVMRLRLVPIDQIFHRFSRMVRDLSIDQGKNIDFRMEGQGIELDSNVLDAITEPILHILRNSIDHGIESPERRADLGKPDRATLSLSCSRTGDNVVIRISDDGYGIDTERIKSVAIEKGLITEQKAERFSEDDVLNLLGTPGLSSSDKITDLSGRGVGFNVVRQQIGRIGGQIRIVTKKGFGTTMFLTIPLSLAIIGGLIVSVNNERYVIPTSNVKTALKIDSSEIKNVHGQLVIMHQDMTIPLVHVDDVLKIGFDKNKKPSDDKITIVVVEKSSKLLGLIVDSFEHKREIVVMRLAGNKVFDSSFSNATILPDGRVSLLLDPEILV